MRTSPIRFTGLASGLDTESLVNAMVMPYKNKVETQQKNQTMLEWKKEAWRDMNTKIVNFYDKYIGKMRLTSTLDKRKVSVSHPDYLSVTGGSNAPVGTHEIKINQMATGSRVPSSTINYNPKVTKPATQDTTLGQLGITEETTLTITQKDGTQSEVDVNSGMKLGDLATQLDNASGGAWQVTVDGDKLSLTTTGADESLTISSTDKEVLGKLGFTAVADETNPDQIKYNVALTKDTTTSKLTYQETSSEVKKATKDTKLSALGITTEETISFKVNGKDAVEVTLKPDMTMQQLETAVKAAAPDWNVNFDESAGALFISSKESGASQSMEIIAGTGVLHKLGLATSESDTKVQGTVGTDASIVYNGVTVTSTTNQLTVNGLTVEIKGMPPADTSIEIVSTQDTDGIVDFVKEFIGEYNKLIEDIYGKLNATSAKGFEPLTAEEKEAMSDKEIEQWEQKIKDSVLRNDSELKAVADSMRNVLNSVISSNEEFKTLTSVGITTGAWNENGKLYLDEDKLKEAISKNANEVVELFAGNASKSGLGDLLYDELGKNMKSNTLSSINSFYNDKVIDKKITNLGTEVYKLQERMYKMEDMYYARFTAMEKMMSQLNNQSNWLTSQLGGM